MKATFEIHDMRTGEWRVLDEIPDGSRFKLPDAVGFVPPPFAKAGDQVRFLADGVLVAIFTVVEP